MSESIFVFCPQSTICVARIFNAKYSCFVNTFLGHSDKQMSFFNIGMSFLILYLIGIFEGMYSNLVFLEVTINYIGKIKDYSTEILYSFKKKLQFHYLNSFFVLKCYSSNP